MLSNRIPVCNNKTRLAMLFRNNMDRNKRCLTSGQALNPLKEINPRIEVLNQDPVEKSGISQPVLPADSTYNFEHVLHTSQNLVSLIKLFSS